MAHDSHFDDGNKGIGIVKTRLLIKIFDNEQGFIKLNLVIGA